MNPETVFMENRRQIDAQTVRLRKSVRRRTGGNEGAMRRELL